MSALLSKRLFDDNFGSRALLVGLLSFMIVVAGYFRYTDLVSTSALSFRSLSGCGAVRGDIVLSDVRLDAP